MREPDSTQAGEGGHLITKTSLMRLGIASLAVTVDPTIPARAFAVIKGLVDSGVIKESRIDQSYRRIMRLKARLEA